jgi:hypothetical protein
MFEIPRSKKITVEISQATLLLGNIFIPENVAG